jgi:hypothetical protein
MFCSSCFNELVLIKMQRLKYALLYVLSFGSVSADLLENILESFRELFGKESL